MHDALCQMEAPKSTNVTARTIVLEIIEAKDLPLSLLTKRLPSAFVEVIVEGFVVRTRLVKRTRSPMWKETITIPRPPDAAMLTFSVFHRANALWNYRISAVVVTVEMLLKGQPGADHFTLTLRSVRGKSGGGVLVVRGKEEQLGQSATTALDETRLARQQLFRTLENSETASSLLDLLPSLSPFLDLADKIASLHPYVNIAWQLASLVVKIPRQQLQRDAGIINLINEMEELYSFVNAMDKLKKMHILEDAVQAILNQTVECSFFIRGYTHRNFGERVMLQSVSDTSEKIGEFRDQFRRLRARFDTSSTIQISFVSSRSLKIVEDMRRDQILAKLRPVAMPVAGRPSCLENTRLDVIKLVTDWIADEAHQKPVFWLSGMTGTGKSTISTTIADISRGFCRLGAYIFFNRDVEERSDPATMIRTLAYKLARFYGTIGDAVVAAIESSPDIAESSLAFQFRMLIAEPLASVDPLDIGGPIVIVVDALDECGDATSRTGLLTVLSRGFSKLPSFVRILVTSRRTRDIESVFQSHPCVHPYELDPTSDSTAKDIEIFIQSQMEAVRVDNNDLELPADWPGRNKIQVLTVRAAGLFVWASTACLFIKEGHDPRQRVDQVLNTSESKASSPLEGLDGLYKAALQFAGNWGDPVFWTDCRAIIGLILVAKIPLRCKAIDDLLCLPRPSLHTVKNLGSVLRWSDTNPIRILHPSFQDFLTHQGRCGGDYWFVDVTLHHRNLARACVDLLERALTKNICNLKLGEPFDANALPESVTYACLHWIDHLCMGVEADPERIFQFLAAHLLHWMEAMSILQVSRIVIRELRELDGWGSVVGIQIFPRPDPVLSQFSAKKSHAKLCRLVHEAERFAQFFADTCAEHPLLIYAAALSFTPVDSCISELFHDDRTLDVTGSIRSQGWPRRLLQIQGHSKLVQAVVFSPDGSKIASASLDKTIRVWDVLTGAELLPPLEGHTRVVRSIAFSPDGSKIVSGSWDKTIRVWDTTTGAEILPPLQGHEEAVLSVVCSPDGTTIVSGSDDKSIRMWDTNTGKQTVLLADAHKEGVRSISFASDGSKFASGSYDKTIRVWDARTATSLLPPFRAHEHWVLSIAFSPDGSKIVSGAWDTAIKIWDAGTGENILSVPDAHQPPVEAVAFVPDGSMIMSCSGDNTIRFWDARTGKQTLAPLLGHDMGIRSAAISPDGKKVVSGAGDTTVGVWDISARVSAKNQGHTMRISSVAFSPDGSKMASGSADKTIRLWDVGSGDEICSPLEGHEGAVFSVAFSPDGSKLVSGSGDSTIRVWKVATGELALPPLRGHDDWVLSVAWSPEGSRLISGSGDRTVRVWDAVTGTEVRPPLRGHKNAVTSVTVWSDGSKIVSGSWDRTVCVWDAVTWAMTLATPRLSKEATASEAITPDIPKQILGGFGRAVMDRDTDRPTETLLPFSVAWSPDGSTIAVGAYNKVARGWATSSGVQAFPPLCHHTHWILSVAFGPKQPDRTTFATASWDKTVRVWNLKTGTEDLPVLQGHDDAVFSVAYSPDGLKIASGSGDKTIRVWCTTTGIELLSPLRGHDHRVHSVAFSPDSSAITSGSWDKTIRIWNSSTGAEAFPPLLGHDGPVLSVVFTPDGSKIVSGSVDKTVRIWSIGAEIGCVCTLQGHSDWVFSVAVSRDGSMIASGSADGVIQMWDISSGSDALPPLEGHDMAVMSVAFSPDGAKLVSGSWDQTIRVWDIKTRSESMPLIQGHDAVLLVAFSADGSQLVSWSFGGTHRIWDIQPGMQASRDPNAPIMLLRKHGIAYPVSSTSPSAGLLTAGEPSVKSTGWIEHTTTGCHVKIPAAIRLSDFRAHGSMLVAWTDGYQPIFIQFR